MKIFHSFSKIECLSNWWESSWPTPTRRRRRRRRIGWKVFSFMRWPFLSSFSDSISPLIIFLFIYFFGVKKHHFSIRFSHHSFRIRSDMVIINFPSSPVSLARELLHGSKWLHVISGKTISTRSQAFYRYFVLTSTCIRTMFYFYEYHFRWLNA